MPCRLIPWQNRLRSRKRSRRSWNCPRRRLNRFSNNLTPASRTREKWAVPKGQAAKHWASDRGQGDCLGSNGWFVKFGERASLDEYAKQLDFFGIELGALLPDGRLAYMKNMLNPVPEVRYINSGSDEARLYMTWQGGERRAADTQLFAKANINVRADTVIFHFYPKETENTLARLNSNFAIEPSDKSAEPITSSYRMAPVINSRSSGKFCSRSACETGLAVFHSFPSSSLGTHVFEAPLRRTQSTASNTGLCEFSVQSSSNTGECHGIGVLEEAVSSHF